MDPLCDRVPPSNRAAERAVLGAILRDPDVLPDVLDVVRAESFYFDAHQRILAATADLAGQRKPVDLVSLHDELSRRKHLDDVGGPAYRAELWEAVPTGASAIYHAKLVREAATLRALVHAANEVLRDAYDRTGSAEELLAAAGARLHAIGLDAAGDGAEPRRVGAIAREVVNALDDQMSSGDSLSGLPTGYPDLDRVTGGFRPGELVVIGARPSLGKTALALNIAEKIAESGTPVLFFSLEMPGRDIASRVLSMRSGVPMYRMSRPRELRTDDIDARYRAANTDLADTGEVDHAEDPTP
jgi:replicative DNA helicase